MPTNNEVELIGHYGGDKSHALSAWTSTSRELNEDKEKRVGRLLNMLAEAGHHTPFEKSSIHFLVTTDIASHIHILKHRVGVSVNAESARYKELQEDKYYLPEDWGDIRNSKPLEIFNLLNNQVKAINVMDPCVVPEELVSKYDILNKDFSELPQADITIIANRHEQFLELTSEDLLRVTKPHGMIFDIKDTLTKELETKSIKVWKL